MSNKTDDLVTMINNETKKRIEIYYDFGPGTDACEVTPFTIQKIIPAVLFSVLLVGLFIWGGVIIFPKYFPG
ncbi:MAG: hypothetical protein K9L30_00025 [Desulfobacterales bacterium]|nr:hypothetical protein [Desulfobacterales bacterium]